MGNRLRGHKSIQVFDFSKGLNLKKSLAKLNPGELSIATNVVLQEEGSIEKRKGYAFRFGNDDFYGHITKMFTTKDNGIIVIYEDRDSSNHKIKSKWGVASFDFLTDAPSPLNLEEKPGIVEAGDHFAIVGDGVNDNFKIYYTVYSQYGLTAPTSVQEAVGPWAAAVNVAAGNLDGDYTYKITYLSTYGHESNCGTVSNTVSPSSEKVDLTGIPVSGEEQVNTGGSRKIYRSKNGGGWFYIATIADNTTTTYTDNIADTAIGSELSIKNGIMPKCKYFGYAGDRVWGAGNTINPNYVYYSARSYDAQEGIESYNEGVDFIVVDDDSDEITGLASYDNYIFVFKKNSIHLITAYDISIQKIQGNMGCTAPETIEVTPYGVCFYSESGYWLHNGAKLHNIGESIESVFRTDLKVDQTDQFVSLYNPGDKQLWFSCPMNTGTIFKKVVITNGGTGYSAGTLVVSGGGGSGLAGTYTVAAGVIDSIALSNFGSGYTSAPTVTPSDAGNGDAVLTAEMITNPNDTVYVFHMDRTYPHPREELRFPIAKYDLAVRTMGVFRDTGEIEKIMFANYISDTYEALLYIFGDTNTDDGSDIAMDIMTGNYYGEAIGQDIIVKRIDIILESTNAEQVTLTVCPNFSTSGAAKTVTTTGGSVPETKKAHFNKIGKSHGFRVQRTSDEDMKIIGMTIYYREGSWK